MSGRRVRVLANGPRVGGEHASRWDGVDGAGRRAATGSYFVRLVANGAVRSQRVLMIR